MAKAKRGNGMLRTTNEVIGALGGYRAVINLTGTSPQVVTNWKNQDTFPARFFVLMDAELRKRGYRAPASLWGMRQSATTS